MAGLGAGYQEFIISSGSVADIAESQSAIAVWILTEQIKFYQECPPDTQLRNDVGLTSYRFIDMIELIFDDAF